MLKIITYSFPQETDTANFFASLTTLFRELPNANVGRGKISLTALQPADSLPITVFEQRDIPFPEVRFGSDDTLSLKISNLHINKSASVEAIVPGQPLPKTLKQDALGSYYAVDALGKTLFRLPMAELCTRLAGRIVRIDHTGLNIPSAIIPKQVWEQFIGNLGRQSNLYRYPTGEEWPFILPATAEEFATDITAFPVGREPKFELVYDTYSPVPSVQIDIETDLNRQEVEQLFPVPYGVSFPELADYFRTVYVDHCWPGLDIRFDIRFKNTELDNDWETGKWLVTAGGRIAN